MADTQTTNLSLTKPEVGVEDAVTDWGVKLNTNLDTVDAKWDSVTPAAQIVGAGSAGTDTHVARADHVHPMAATSVTANRAVQSNSSTGVLEASSVTNTELGYVSGATSAIQTQLDAKRATFADGQLPGSATNDDAAAGKVGQYIAGESLTDVNAAGTGTWDDLASISLTAGDWDVSALAVFDNNGATWTVFYLGIHTSSGNVAAPAGQVAQLEIGSTSTVITRTTLSVPIVRVSLASTTTIYLKRLVTYSAGTPRTRQGWIRARRVR